jgi:hypothetical protein
MLIFEWVIGPAQAAPAQRPAGAVVRVVCIFIGRLNTALPARGQSRPGDVP